MTLTINLSTALLMGVEIYQKIFVTKFVRSLPLNIALDFK